MKVSFCIPNLNDWTVACKNAHFCEVGKNLEGGAVSARQEWRAAPPTKFSPNSYKWGRSQATVQLPEELKIIERQLVTPRKLNGNFFCSWGVIFMVYPFHSPDLLLPVICINNGKFSSVCTLLWNLVGVVIISGKTCSKTTRTSLLARKKHRDSVSWWMCLVTVVSTWTEIAHAHEFGVLTVSLRSRCLEVLNGRPKERDAQGRHLACARSFLCLLIPSAFYAG